MIFLIEKIWTDSMENSCDRAVGYSPASYVNTEEEAKEFCTTGREYTPTDCWAITEPMPEYKYSIIGKAETSHE